MVAIPQRSRISRSMSRLKPYFESSSCSSGGVRSRLPPHAGLIRVPAATRASSLAPRSRQQGRAPSSLKAIVPGSAPGTQRFVCGEYDSGDIPLGYVQTLPETQQAAIFFGIMSGISFATALVCTYNDLSWAKGDSSALCFGVIFLAAGYGHFQICDQFCSMIPPQGAWGIWRLPGSDEFHSKWTGVAEAAGGLGLLASAVPSVSEALPWLGSASAVGLFALVLAVTPANILMFTHNAPGPGPKGAVISPLGHLFRGVMQVVLLSALWGFAHR